jgi:hypothetical protein
MWVFIHMIHHIQVSPRVGAILGRTVSISPPYRLRRAKVRLLVEREAFGQASARPALEPL